MCTFSANLSGNIAVCRVLIMNIIGKGQNPLLCHLSLDNTEVLSNRPFAASPFMWHKTPLLESTRKMQSEKTNKGNLMTYSLFLSCPSVFFARQYGGFAPREWLAVKGLFGKTFLAGVSAMH